MNADKIIKKHELDKKSWTHKGAHAILHYFFPVGEPSFKPLLDYFGECATITVFYIKGNYVDWYWNDEDMIRLNNSFLKKVKKNPKFADKLLNEWHKKVKILNKIINKIDKTNFSKLNDNELLKLYYEYYNAYVVEYGLGLTIEEAFSLYSDEFLMPHFKQIIHGLDFNEYYSILTSLVTESFLTREYRDRLKILKSKKGLKNHVKKYHWLRNNYAKDIYLDEKYFMHLLKGMKVNPDKELKRLDNEIKEIKKKKKELIKKLKLDKKSKILLKIVEIFGYIQDERKKYVLISSHYQNLFIKEFGKKFKINRNLMEYTIIHDIKDIINGKFDKKEILKRKKAVMCINTLKGYEIISGKKSENVYNKVFAKKEKKVDLFKGMVASKGKVKGVVRIIRTMHDFINFDDGDILVASMTRPEMVVLMQKASAIITDEGGITCHAAVVSRELKKPCIINTKIASSVLKNGDLVEVDANKGIVKIIEKK